MRKKDIIKVYADFETTIDSTAMTEVWSAASITEEDASLPCNVKIQRNLSDFMGYILNDIQHDEVTVYFHNEKFDGSFILYWLLSNKKFKPDYIVEDGNVRMNDGKVWKMKNDTFRYTISAKGQWYQIIIRHMGRTIRIKDSLKLIPLSLAKAGKSFKTPHQKLEMDYKNHRPNDTLTEEEIAYIKNDVLVLKECMEFMFKEGIDAMTIGAACLREFKNGYNDEDYDKMFPDVTSYSIPDMNEDIGRPEYNKGRTVDSFVRRSYHGGFCYVNPKYAGKVLVKGENVKDISHVDANSHYPSQMHSKSGNYYPIGLPIYIHKEQFEQIRNTKKEKCYYFVRIITKFDIKAGMLPMLQMKDDPRFSSKRNEWLESSDGMFVDIVLTRPDYELFCKTYNSETYIVEALAFHVAIGLFDKYIDHWYSIKEKSTGGIRQIAKLLLNNLYGKYAASRDSSYKIAYIDKKQHCLKYHTVIAYDKTPGYIPVGSAITSYARCRTITLAEEYVDYYMYSDTDSNVYALGLHDLDKIPQHESKICYWKVESNSDKAVFVRQKTYIEHVVAEDGKVIDKPYTNLKCCGMGSAAKKNTINRLEAGTLRYEDFTPGYEVEGNLKARQIMGGTLLVEQMYKMH